MAITLDRRATLVLIGELLRIRRGQSEYAPPTRAEIWARPITLNLNSDPTAAGLIPVGAIKLAVRYRADLAQRVAFDGTWTPAEPGPEPDPERFDNTAEYDAAVTAHKAAVAEYEAWRPYLDNNAAIRDSVVFNGVLYAITEASEITTEPRRRYVALYGAAVRTIQEVTS